MASAAEKKPMSKWMIAGWCFLALVILGALLPKESTPTANVASDSTQNAVSSNPFQDAKPFTIVKDEANPHPRKARIYILAPTAISPAERASTVKLAAVQLNQKEGKAVNDVILEFDAASVGGGNWLGRAIYYADGCDISGQECGKKEWDVQVSDTVVDQQQVAMYRVWQENKNTPQFTTKDGAINEDKLTAFIAKQFKVKPEQVKFPEINTPKAFDNPAKD